VHNGFFALYLFSVVVPVVDPEMLKSAFNPILFVNFFDFIDSCLNYSTLIVFMKTSFLYVLVAHIFSLKSTLKLHSFFEKQVTRGHNIVADGWAGASNPHPHPNPSPTLKHTQKVSKTLVFPLFNSMTMTDKRTNGRTDGRTKPLIELRVRN